MTVASKADNEAEKSATFGKGALRIIEAAEDLIGRNGLAVTSMRQIATAAGQTNPAAVQYHFGSMEGLLEAIYRYRVPMAERCRGELMQDAPPAAGGNLSLWLRTISRPFMEIRNANGRRAFAHFSRAMAFGSQQPTGYQRVITDAPITNQLVDLIREAMPPQPMDERDLKMGLAFQLILRAVCALDEDNQERRYNEIEDERMFDIAITMAEAALGAPPKP